MTDVSVGDVFRDYGAPDRTWRIVADNGETSELVCLEKPNLSRFVRLEKLLEPHRYIRLRSMP